MCGVWSSTSGCTSPLPLHPCSKSTHVCVVQGAFQLFCSDSLDLCCRERLLCDPGEPYPQWTEAEDAPDFVALWNRPKTSHIPSLQRNVIGAIEQVRLT